MKMVKKAWEIARRAHRGQLDKTGEPYIRHSEYVARLMSADNQRTVAFLHDVAEDTPLTLEDLRLSFPEEIIDAVDAITRRKDQGETYFDYIRRCRKNEIARVVKIADIKHNADSSRGDFDGRDGLIKRGEKALRILEERGE